MAQTYVLRMSDRNSNDHTTRCYLWQGLRDAGRFCRYVRFFRTIREAQTGLERARRYFPMYAITIEPAFND